VNTGYILQILTLVGVCGLYFLIINRSNKIMATQAEHAQDIRDVTTQLQKIGNESAKTLAKVTELEEALANQGNVSQEVQEAMQALKAQVTIVDDMVPDAEPEEPTES